MTPFGLHIRALRAERGITQRDMAAALGVSPAYLSAMEHGKRGRPGWEFVQKVIGYFNIIWDDAEELQRLAILSDPKVVIDTSELSPMATRAANRFAETLPCLDEAGLETLLAVLDELSAG